MVKKLLVWVLVLLLLAGALLWGVRNFLVSSTLERLRSGAATQGVVFSFGAQRTNLFTVTLTDVRIDGVLRRFPITLRIDEISISPAWNSFFEGKVGVELMARMYHGDIQGSASASWNGNSISLAATAERLEVSEHPMIQALGINRGQVSLFIPSLTSDPSGTTGSFVLKVIRLGKRSATKFPGGSLGPITVPAFERINAEVKGGIRDRTFVVRPLEIESDFGSFKGNFAIEDSGSPRTDTEAPLVSGRATAHLSSSGQQLIGQWLPVISNGTVTADVSRFEIHVSGSTKHPVTKMLPQQLAGN